MAEGATTRKLSGKRTARNNSWKAGVGLTEGVKSLRYLDRGGSEQELLWKHKKQLYTNLIKT